VLEEEEQYKFYVHFKEPTTAKVCLNAHDQRFFSLALFKNLIDKNVIAVTVLALNWVI
jgi:hypothetical protein